jgi:hypothetical protein
MLYSIGCLFCYMVASSPLLLCWLIGPLLVCVTACALPLVCWLMAA